MNDENFSVVDNEKNKRKISGGRSSSVVIQILIALGLNVFVYSATYFRPLLFTNSRGNRDYIFYVVAAGGFYLFYNIIELYKQSHGESIEDVETGIDAEFMGTYSYTTSQDKKWLAYVASAVGGGINVLLYLAFLGFVVK